MLYGTVQPCHRVCSPAPPGPAPAGWERLPEAEQENVTAAVNIEEELQKEEELFGSLDEEEEKAGEEEEEREELEEDIAFGIGPNPK